MKPQAKRWILILAVLGVLAVILTVGVQLQLPYVSAVAGVLLGGIVLLLGLWLFFRLLRAFLWKVGRRLAFSYFLIGGLPIPMALLLLGLLSYLLAGLFLGHLYRDVSTGLQTDVERAAERQLGALETAGAVPSAQGEDIAFGYYRQGRRIGGDLRTPAVWPAWVNARPSAGQKGGKLRLFRFDPAQPEMGTLAATAGDRDRGVLAVYTGRLDRELSRRTDFWIELSPVGDEGLESVDLVLWKIRVPLLNFRASKSDGQKVLNKSSEGRRLWDDPILWWGEVSGAPLDLATGRPTPTELAVTVNSTPRLLVRAFAANASEFDARIWAALVILAILLSEVYFVAVLMAVFLIFNLSRAVNRLSRATNLLQQGDFAMRIPVRRKDQIGALQRSFNDMAANLERLVESAAQKELLDKELALARDLQMSLVPDVLPGGPVELATLFEPSAAIGGDYFDVLLQADGQLVVLIADVSGHGLTAGLRMAMLKASLGVLVEETREPVEILRRLDGVVRSNGQNRRSFVTATLALIDPMTGRLHLTNAGHPPTYRIHDRIPSPASGPLRQVDEILLPGSPLGGLGYRYGEATVTLEPGDFVIWLSDGLIEATNAAGEPFGYERIVQTFQGIPPQANAAEVRDSLLTAVEQYVEGTPFGDDRTMVVLRWRGVRSSRPSAPES
ncbi:MAG TPA: SpoIIE family protein phosphatase [Thermoanaerobaculia bacterium]|nr:SpoIIE family protein phosphatase [Thermoanaerobaculia bacterium]